MDTWDPERKPLLKHLSGVLDGIAINKKRIGPNLGAHLEERPDGKGPLVCPAADEDELASASPHADAWARPAGGFELPDTSRVAAFGGADAYGEHDLARRILDITTRDLANDPIALEVLGAYAEGVESPRDQADALGRPLNIILAARRRVERHATRARAKLEGSDDS
jgi:hypothetical protein